MRIARFANGDLSPIDGIRYGLAHLFNALVLLATLGRYNTDSVSLSSLKMARRYMIGEDK